MHVTSYGLFAALVCGAVSAALAQGVPTATATGPRVPIPFTTYVAGNPLVVPLDIASLEIESGIAQGVTIGGSGSYADINHDHYTTFDAKLRFYPGEIVLRDLSVGLSVGSLQYSAPTDSGRTTIRTPTVGLLIDYNWLIGPSRRFVVGTGVALKRVLAGSDERDRVGLGRVYPTGRFVVGYAF